MRFKIVGANSETGDDVDVMMEAGSLPEVEKLAHDKGILVSSIAPVGGPQPAHAPAHAPASGHASHVSAPAHAHASHAPAAHASASHAPAAQASQASGAHPPAAAPAAAPAAPAAHKPPKEKDFSSIDLVDDEPPAGSDPSAPRAERAHGLITVNANAPSEGAHTGSGSIDQGKHAETAMEYHVILNQSLFLLESAVNKHLRDGWEPAGGVAVGVANNAMQFFQGLIRKKKPAGT